MAWAGPHRRHSYAGGGLPPQPPPASRYSPLQSPASPFHASIAASPPAASPSNLWARSGSSAAPSPTTTHGSSPASMTAAAAASASADEEQLQSVLSALRVALSKKEAALVSVAGQLAEVQERLAGSEAERAQLAAALREAQAASGGSEPGGLPAAAALTIEGRLLAQARQELGQAMALASELAAERDALTSDVAMLQQQLTAAAQAEAQERERLCAEATQCRLLARARARQVEQLQAEVRQAAGAVDGATAAAKEQLAAATAEAAAAKAAAAEARARASAANAEAAQLKEQFAGAQTATQAAEARAASAEAGVVDARQQAEWQALRISELEQTSGAGQLMRRYDAELGRLRSAHEAELAGLRQQLAQQQHHQQQQQQPAAAAPAACSSQPAGEPAGLDSAAWAALFGEPSQQAPADTHDAAAQTDAQAAASAGTSEADADLLEAARLEIERLQELNEGLMESHAAAQHSLHNVLESQRHAALAAQQQRKGRQAEAGAQQIAVEAAQRAEAAVRGQLALMEHQVMHQSGEVAALRQANEKLELLAAALKEELEAADERVPAAEVEVLRSELQRAGAHTESLEVQVQQLKTAAEAAAQQHAASEQEEEQRRAADVAAQVASAAAQHDQQVEVLQARLAQAQQELQEAHSALSELVQEQLLRQQCTTDAAVQAGRSGAPAVLCSAAQTDAEPDCWPSVLSWQGAAWSGLAEASPLALGWGGSTAGRRSCGGGSEPSSLPETMTASELQLELARVKFGPFKPLPGSGKLAAGRLAAAPSRLASACGEHGSLYASSSLIGSPSGGSALAGWASTVAGVRSPLPTEAAAEEAEVEDEGFATPMAQTPAASPPSVAPLQSADRRTEWDGEQQQQQQQQHGAQVPALPLHLVRPYTSLSCGSTPAAAALGGASGTCGLLPASRASTSGSSLSSLGPSASQLAYSWTPADHAAAGLPVRSTSAGGSGDGWMSAGEAALLGSGGLDDSGSLGSDLDGGVDGLSSSGSDSSWQAHRLDASLARLAALTSGLVTAGAAARQQRRQ